MFVDDMHFVATIVGAVLVITGAPTLMFCIALEVSRNFGDRINPPMPDAMQARMLREIPLLRWHRQQAKVAFATTEEIARHCRALSDALYGAGFSISDFGRKS